MADNKKKQGKADDRKVAAGQGYEVAYAARKFETTQDKVREAIKKVGNDREKLKKHFGK